MGDCDDSRNELHIYRGGILFALFPYFFGKRWFVETYIILILFAPFMSRLLQSISRKNYSILLGIQIVIFSVWYSVGLSAPVLDDGYGILNFITLYMIGGYIRLYGNEIRWLNLSRGKYLLLYLACAVLTFGLSYFINPFGYCFITNIVGAASIFVFAEKMTPRSDPVINRFGGAAFDVYFVHSDVGTSGLLISGLLLGRYFTDSPWMLLHLPIAIALIYLLGTGTNVLRRKLNAVTVDRLLDRCQWLNQNHSV